MKALQLETPCNMECLYNAPETLMKQRGKLLKEGKKKEDRTRRDETQCVFHKLPLYRQCCMLSKISLRQIFWPIDQCSVLTVEPLHMLQHKFLKNQMNVLFHIFFSSEKPIIGKQKHHISKRTEQLLVFTLERSK